MISLRLLIKCSPVISSRIRPTSKFLGWTEFPGLFQNTNSDGKRGKGLLFLVLM